MGEFPHTCKFPRLPPAAEFSFHGTVAGEAALYALVLSHLQDPLVTLPLRCPGARSAGTEGRAFCVVAGARWASARSPRFTASFGSSASLLILDHF